MIPDNECTVLGIADALQTRGTVLTSDGKTVPLNDSRKLVCQMRLKADAQPTRVEVVLCDLFTTSKSLESLRAQNVKSPLSAIFVPERLSCTDPLDR